jgi:protocatechuate 4,5-dioxygenase alpha chain
MNKSEKEYDDIPGTIVFDGGRLRQGYHFNMFCCSLINPKNRDAFLADQEGYLSKYKMSEAQRQAVLKRDWKAMLELGGNIFYMNRIGFCDRVPAGELQAAMTGMTREDYRQMLADGGRPIEGNRSKKENLRG